MKQTTRLLTDSLFQRVASHRITAGYRNLTASALVLAALQVPGLALALDAPCSPGNASVWALAAKDFLGTALDDQSRVYFTGAEGILTEVFYPTLDKVQNVDLQFLVTDAKKTWGDEERRQKQHEISQVNTRAMLWQAVTTADSGKWKITKKIFTDPGRHAVIQRVTFQTLEPGKAVRDYNVYVLNNPAINGTGAGNSVNQCGGDAGPGPDNSRTLTANKRTMLVASEPHATSSALAISLPWKVVGGNTMVSSGFVGRNDGFTDLFAGNSDKTMDFQYDGAFGGNVAQMGWIDFGNSTASSISFNVVLAFGDNEQDAGTTANATLGSDLNALEKTYTDEWIAYTNGLDNQNGKADDQYYLAAMTLKTIQDKSNGAMIAGPGTPWGETSGDSNKGGYHLVWSRDLFKFASALIAAGDTKSANRAVEYLFNIQMQSNGRFPQNSYVDGTPYWNATQMDETAMPIILAWKLNRVGLWSKIKPAAEFLAHNGPRTNQERWEEAAGYSPSTIAAEVAGLVCAASLANDASDPGAADFYLQKADEWRNNVANWTFTTAGPHGNGQYYVRITDTTDPNTRPDPNAEAWIKVNDGAGWKKVKEVVDVGFLELVRLGVMSPHDWTVRETIPEYEQILKDPKLNAFFRYNYDWYGENNEGRQFISNDNRGRIWPIFTAERGIYEIALTGKGENGNDYLSALKVFSSPAGFISEQIWNNNVTLPYGWETNTPSPYVPGTATKSIRPLSWAMGEYINLIAAMNQNHNDAPTVVCQRYACDKPQTRVTFKVRAATNWGENIYLVGNNPLLSNWVPAAGIKLSPTSYPVWNVTVSLPAETPLEYKYVKRDGSGITLWEGGSNRTFTTPPPNGEMTREDNFQ